MVSLNIRKVLVYVLLLGKILKKWAEEVNNMTNIFTGTATYLDYTVIMAYNSAIWQSNRFVQSIYNLD